MRRWLPLLALVCPAAWAGADEPTSLLPELSLRLQGARYSPAEPDFAWDGWLGGGAGLLRAFGTTAYFDADVETIIGTVRRRFDANQANYVLEAGLKHRFGRSEAALSYHHVSRHEQDRAKDQTVDWNVLGVRASHAFGGHVPVRAGLGLGHTTLTSLVTYRWEITGQLDAELLRRPWGRLYALADLRGVTTESSPDSSRKGFVDVWIEAGVRFPRSAGTLDLFAAYQHRNDVYVQRPGYRDWALLGFRIGHVTSSSPTSSGR